MQALCVGRLIESEDAPDGSCQTQISLPGDASAENLCQACVAIGDLFEAKVEGRTITLVPKRLIDASCVGPERSQAHVKGPFPTAQATVRALRRRTA
jgi:hypothetical protein